MSKRAEFRIKGRRQVAKPYRYRASGLDNVFLLNGVEIEETPYGPMVTIEDLNGLHRAIGLHIVEKAEPMTGPEFRFLRKQLELTQVELGRHLRVTDQTVANYEKGHTALGPVDPLMRGFYLLYILPEQTRIAVLKTIASKFSARKEAKLPQAPRRIIVENWEECGMHAA